MTIRVPLADDQTLLRAIFRMLIDSCEDLEVVDKADDGGKAVELSRAHHPDVVLMDIRMPGTDGLAATAAICADPNLPATPRPHPHDVPDRRARRPGRACRRERLSRQERLRRRTPRRHPHCGRR